MNIKQASLLLVDDEQLVSRDGLFRVAQNDALVEYIKAKGEPVRTPQFWDVFSEETRRKWAVYSCGG
jgi:hypothetical protein